MLMLLRQSFLVADWLDCGVVVILVNFTVHSLGDILMAISVNVSVLLYPNVPHVCEA